MSSNVFLAICEIVIIGVVMAIIVANVEHIVEALKGASTWFGRFLKYKSGHGRHAWKGANMMPTVSDAWMPA